MIKTLIKNAKKAEKELSHYTQEELDAIVKTIAKTVYDNAEILAKEAVEETEMGVYEDKVAKNKGKSKAIWNDLADKKSTWIIKRDEDKKLVLIAKSVGVVGAITPTTNPIVTPMCNAMFAIKGGNPIIIAPHPRAKKCSAHTVDLINEALKNSGIKHPENAIQIIREPSIELTNELMKSVTVVVATGGMGMVKAAYSSGNPSYGVGAGNVQVIIDRDTDLNKAANDIITGRKFDNGIICSGEQSIIAPKEKYAMTIEAFKNNGAYYIEDEETVNKFRKILFVDGHINKDVVGQSVAKLAELAGVEVPAEAKVIILKGNGYGEADVLCKEKMCPVLVALEYDTFEEAVEIAKTNLLMEGAGHTTAVHSNNKKHIQYAGESLPISRLVVNAPSSITAGGSMTNGFAPTTTLGCGTWGNNIISENFTYKHLINVSRIGYVNEEAQIPTDEEIWSK